MEEKMAEVILLAKKLHDENGHDEGVDEESSIINSVETALNTLEMSKWLSGLLIDMLIHRMDETVGWANHLMLYHDDANYWAVFKTKYYDRKEP